MVRDRRAAGSADVYPAERQIWATATVEMSGMKDDGKGLGLLDGAIHLISRLGILGRFQGGERETRGARSKTLALKCNK